MGRLGIEIQFEKLEYGQECGSNASRANNVRMGRNGLWRGKVHSDTKTEPRLPRYHIFDLVNKEGDHAPSCRNISAGKQMAKISGRNEKTGNDELDWQNQHFATFFE